MAKIPDGILSGFRGRIANLVGVKRRGEYYIRSISQFPKNPRTKKQQANRKRFGLASGLAARLDPFISKSFAATDGKTSRGAFISCNLRSAIRSNDEGEPEVDYSNLILSAGPLTPVGNATAERTEEGEIRVRWTDNSGEGSAREKDKVMLLAIYARERPVPAYNLNTSYTRSDEQGLIRLSGYLRKQSLHVYLAVLSDDGAMAANSLYLGDV